MREGPVHQLERLRGVRAGLAARATEQAVRRIEHFEERQAQIALVATPYGLMFSTLPY